LIPPLAASRSLVATIVNVIFQRTPSRKRQCKERTLMTANPSPHLIPLWIKLPYTAFMAVLIPIYLYHYGPTNFLYFCDVAIVVTLLAVWIESPLLLSAGLVGIFLPQMLWVADFFAELFGVHWTGLTGYMFDTRKPFYLRFLSFFHFWLPFFLIYLVWLVGYDKRGSLLWTALTWILVPVCYFLMPGPSSNADPNLPVNINYVHGFSEKEAQTWLAPDLYFAVLMIALPVGIFLPTHLLFQRLMPGPRWQAGATSSPST
jgi:hypothetical protein